MQNDAKSSMPLQLALAALARNDLPISRFMQIQLLFKAQVKISQMTFSINANHSHLWPPLVSPVNGTLVISQMAACTLLCFIYVWLVWQINHILIGPRNWLLNFLPLHISWDNGRHIADSQCTIVGDKINESTKLFFFRLTDVNK